MSVLRDFSFPSNEHQTDGPEIIDITYFKTQHVFYNQQRCKKPERQPCAELNYLLAQYDCKHLNYN